MRLTLLPLNGGKSAEYRTGEGELIIGRGPLLQITDSRVSRNHAVIRINEDGIPELKNIHNNPVYISRKDTGEKVLSKDGVSLIEDGDVIALLKDEVQFKVTVKDEVNAETPSKDIKVDNGVDSHKDVDEKSPVPSPSKEKSNPSPSKDDDTKKVVISKPMALSLDKKRALPGWMCGAASRSPDTKPPPVAKGRGRGRGKAAVASPSKAKKPGHALSDTDEEKPKATTPKKKEDKPTLERRRSSRTTPKKASYGELSSDFEDDDDDWAAKPKKSPSKSPAKKTPTKAGSKRRKSLSSESSEDEYVARPTKRRSKASKEPRDSCQYGEKCYRKNPAHRKEFSHPGDSDYEQDNDGESDDSKPECEFGTDCYRKNPAHRRDFKHTKTVKAARPKRAAALRPKDKKSVLYGASDDESVPNTYDYDDSFIDDKDISGSSSFEPDDESDEDYDPGSDEDIKSLKKEADAFKRNKNMLKK